MNLSTLILTGSFGCLALAIVVLLFVIFRERMYAQGALSEEQTRRAALENRFSTIVDADAEARLIVETAKKQAQQQEAETSKALTVLQAQTQAISTNLDELRRSYQDKKSIYDRLAREVSIFDDRIAFAEMGIYEPHFDFDTSEDFKAVIENVRERQKTMVSNKSAVICRTNWTVDGSTAKGKTMTERNIRLTLRAFNSECDAAIANTRWNNANAMEKRIENARNQIDRHNASNAIEITGGYYQLKLQELRLTHEYREKLKQEREEKAEASRAAKEEQKLLRELEVAEQEEARYQRMLDKAKAEANSVVGPKLEAYTQQIAILEHDLAEAHAKADRARAMAEMTKSGYVYIISNIGSFGPDFIKIGLTRRLDPTDRIRELGDASVPFLFDTHAIIYSDEAPVLEKALHTEFAASRVNATNMRKEFFRISIDEVETAVKRLAPTASFFRDIEAQEYHETLALRNARLAQKTLQAEHTFPVAI